MGLTHIATSLGSEQLVNALTQRLKGDGFPILDGPRRTGDGYCESVLQNLGQIRRLCLERWLAEQRARWSCPHCGSEFTWYDEACSTCGGEVSNCEEEEGRIVDEYTPGRGS
jgi:hypothetical protein